MEYRPDLPAPSGREGAPKAKVAGLDAQNLKDKFTGIRHPRSPAGRRIGTNIDPALRQAALGGRLLNGPRRALGQGPRRRQALHARGWHEVAERPGYDGE